mgnify:CR=1 FL=1
MAAISAAEVKQLRDKTGAGMLDCKKALTENAGDLEAAIDWLRKKGLSAAARMADRIAAEGLVGVVGTGKRGAVVEINSETDFVARNELFQNFVREAGAAALRTGDDLARLKAASYPGGGTVAEKLAALVGTIGENMTLRRVATLAVENGVVATYVHNAVKEGLGKIGVLVALESTGDPAKLSELGKFLAMHVAAARPMALAIGDLDPAAVARERAIVVEQVAASGKPPQVVEKMVEGRMRKFNEDVVLLEQIYVVDGKSRVATVLEQAATQLGAPVKITGFRRFALGEGIERKQSDFASEVAAQLGQ